MKKASRRGASGLSAYLLEIQRFPLPTPGRRARTLGEIGRELGVSREAVRQIEARPRETLWKVLLAEKRTPAAGSKSRGLGVRTARLRPVPSEAERSRSG